MIGNQGQWKEVEVTVDSGAYNNVCGKELMPEIGMKPSDWLHSLHYLDDTTAHYKTPERIRLGRHMVG